MDLIFFIIVSFFTILPITTMAHELGHFFSARICFVKNITVKIGSGKEFFRLKIKDHTVAFHIIPYGGATFFEFSDQLTPKKQIIISLGGPLINGFIAFLLLLPGFGSGDHLMTIWFQWLALFNLWMCAMNLLPYKMGNYYSDGWVILRAIRESLKSSV